jgi:hypothetical protein
VVSPTSEHAPGLDHQHVSLGMLVHGVEVRAELITEQPQSVHSRSVLPQRRRQTSVRSMAGW